MNRTSRQNIIYRIARIAVVALLVYVVTVPTIAQSRGQISAQNMVAEDQKTELGIRQQLVKRKMVELEKKFMFVADRIRNDKPQRAELLVKTYQKSKEQSLTRKMELVSQLLNTQKYDEAEQQLDEVVGILESLIRLLTNEKKKAVSAKQEMESLEKIKQKIKQQLQEQRKQTREVEKASDKKSAAEKVTAQINALKGLIEKQSELARETGNNANAKLNQLDQLADKQFGIRQATDELHKNVSGQKDSLNKDGSFKDMPKPQSGDAVDGSGENAAKDSADQPADPSREPRSAGNSIPTPGDGKQSNPSGDESAKRASEGTPANGKSAEESPADGESAKGKSDRGESSRGGAEGKSQESGESGGQGNGETPSPPEAPPQPGQKALQRAADHQKRAEEKLGSGKPADAKRQQQQALDKLKEALADLKKEKRRIESLPPEAMAQLAREQRRSRDKTLDLIKEMKQAPKSKQEDASGGESGQPTPQQTPGQQQMEQAQQAQNQAAEKMEDSNTQEAQQQQQQAEQKMKEALEEIEDRLSQLREETNEEKLARLEARFQEMLNRQREASALTVEIEDKRANLGIIHHRDQLLILRLATEETEIRELAQQAYDVLLEDGTSVVFPEVVQDIRVDLESASKLLQEDKTDQYTQLVQKEIETGIADLLDALKEARKKKNGGGGAGGQGGQGGKTPLLKQSAELKILRMRQRRLNRRTSKLEKIKKRPGMDEKIDDEIRDAAVMQEKILEMTENIMNKQQ